MYLPSPYKIEAPDQIASFIHTNNFGDLVTHAKQTITSNKVPFLFDQDDNILYGHFGRDNTQLNDIQSSDEALVIFSGAHTYISPRWYHSENTVPTWNFETLQVRGKPSLVNDQSLITMLEKLSEKNERITHQNTGVKPWSMNEVTPDKLALMLNMIVGFKIEITEVKFKSKMSQNRSEKDQLGVIESLNSLTKKSVSNTPKTETVANIMKNNLTS